MSALANIVGQLGELSESELRQLYLMVGVRLGIPDVPAGAKPQKGGGGKASKTPGTSGGKTSKKSKSSKGNPQRKSQWANHPLYQEYSRLKKVVEAQAKEAKTSFNAVDTSEARAYRQAFTQWVEAKHSFRGHGESDQAPKRSEGDVSEEDSSEEEAGPSKAAVPTIQARPGSPQPSSSLAGKSSGGASGGVAKPPSPPGKNKAPAK
jgi:hypothetical protein